METFPERIARAYVEAPEDLMPWFAYTRDVAVKFRSLDWLHVILTDKPDWYASADAMRADVKNGKLYTWRGGNFAPNHPMNLTWPYGFTDYTGYQISRTVHDVDVHYREGFSYSSTDELYGALHSHHWYSAEAQDALFTDDVAIGCYYMVHGEFPDVQRPVIVKSDWRGLRDYLTTL